MLCDVQWFHYVLLQNIDSRLLEHAYIFIICIWRINYNEQIE
jgi:hypothetical protein